MTSMVPREDVAAAVFALIPATGFPAKTVSRRIQPAAQMQPSALPALFQVISDEKPEMSTMEGMYVAVFLFEWFIYAAASSDAAAPSTTLFPIVDAALLLLPPYSNAPFVVDSVGCILTWDGTITYVEGVIANVSIARIPITVKVPWNVGA